MESSAAPIVQDSQLATDPDASPDGRAKPEEFRASLEAVRVAQAAARARARRETRRTRLIVVGVMAAVGVVAWNVSLRRSPKTQTAIAAPAATPAPVVATPAAPTAPTPTQAQPTEAAPVVAATAAILPSGAADGAACDTAFAEHRWQTVTTACAAAFKARPRDSELAMRVAHAHHRRGFFADAGVWARNAIAVDPNVAEGFAILARAETRAGDGRAAAKAYRRYLTLAPRGWHAGEARRALARWGGHRAGDNAP